MHCDLRSAFVCCFPPLWCCCIFFLPSLIPMTLAGAFLLLLTHCFWLNREYMAQPQLSFKRYDVSSVKKRFGLIRCLYMNMRESVWWRVTAHLTGSLGFLQMRSIQEATRGRTLLGGSYYFSITIETKTLAFSWSRLGVRWHQLSFWVLTKPQTDHRNLNNAHLCAMAENK